MKKVLASFAIGDHLGVQVDTGSRQLSYAQRHDYFPQMSIGPNGLGSCLEKLGWCGSKDRGWHWWKVPYIAYMFDHLDAELILWLDSDCLILDDSVDVAGELTSHAWQSLIFYETSVGTDPGTGTWLLRREMLPYLRRMWEEAPANGDEDTALRALIGPPFSEHPRRYLVTPRLGSNELLDHTHWMGHQWGWIERDQAPVEPPRIYHPCDLPIAERRARIQAVCKTGWMPGGPGGQYAAARKQN